MPAGLVWLVSSLTQRSQTAFGDADVREELVVSTSKKRRRSSTDHSRQLRKRELEELLAAAVQRAQSAEQRADEADSRVLQMAVSAKLTREEVDEKLTAAVQTADMRLQKMHRDMDTRLQQRTERTEWWEAHATQATARCQALQLQLDAERRQQEKDQEVMACVTADTEEEIERLKEERNCAVQRAEQLSSELAAALTDEQSLRGREAHWESQVQAVQEQLKERDGELDRQRREWLEERERDAAERAAVLEQADAALKESKQQEPRHQQEMAECKQRLEEAQRLILNERDELSRRVEQLERRVQQQSTEHAELYYQQAQMLGANLAAAEVQLRTERQHTQRLKAWASDIVQQPRLWVEDRLSELRELLRREAA